MAKKYYEEQYINNAAIAIKNKIPTANKFKVSQFSSLIDSMKVGEPESKDVDFYDYDGTRLYSYTLEEVQELTELPPLPNHTADGLVSQGWTWPLDELKEAKSPMDIGLYVKTSDDKCHVFVEIPSIVAACKLRLYSYVAGDIHVDWGDGNSAVSETSGYTIFEHTYGEVGTYEVTFWITSDNPLTLYSGDTFAGGTENDPSGLYVKKILLPSGIKISGYVFRSSKVEVISIPSDAVPDNNHHHFQGVSYLRCLVLPHWFEGSTWYHTCGIPTRIEHICVPYYTSVSLGMSTSSYNLKRICLPYWGMYDGYPLEAMDTMSVLCDVSTITTGLSFGNNSKVTKLYLMCQTQVPTYHSTMANFFKNKGTLYIPESLHADWIAAEGWSDYADQIVGLVI